MPYRSDVVSVREFARLICERRESSFMIHEFSQGFVGTVESLDEGIDSLAIVLVGGERRVFSLEDRLNIMEHFPKKKRRKRE